MRSLYGVPIEVQQILFEQLRVKNQLTPETHRLFMMPAAESLDFGRNLWLADPG